MAKKKFKTGNVDIPPEEFDPTKAKVRLSLFVDADVLNAFKKAAKSNSHGEYQTLMRETLKETIFGKQVDKKLVETLREIVREELKKVG
jgi:uncharacterized protein (DUF4415 family)